MDPHLLTYIFYLAIIVVPSVLAYLYSLPENKMVYSLSAALVGVIVSFLFWYLYGRTVVGLPATINLIDF